MASKPRYTPILRKLPGVTLPNVAFQEENRWYDEMLGRAVSSVAR